MEKWLDNFNDSKISFPEGFVGEGIFNGPKFTNPSIKGQFQLGGTLPGASGHMYTRIGAPSNEKYAKKTLSSAKEGNIIKDDNGYWNPDNWGKPVEINSNDITMEGVYEPLVGISNTGDTKLMLPNQNYKFKGKKVVEYPIAQNGINQEDQKTYQHIDQLINFTNYNTKQSGGWLDLL